MKVFKFGGASVKDAEAIRNVSTILKHYKNGGICIVISAMGKTTNALEGILNAYFHKTGDPFILLEELKTAHYKVLDELFPQGHPVYDSLNDTFVEIEWVIEEEIEDTYDYLYDQIVSIGEFLSTKIVAAYLNEQGLATTWLDARDVIHTDNTHREGIINWDKTKQSAQSLITPLFDKGLVLTQGFIGVTSENFTTTLGREGSDYTAAILSHCLDAESMTVWKDVPGILTADPRLFKNVTKIDRLSYREAIEMTYYGAKVIHPKTIKPLQNKLIPLHVKSFIKPYEEGTLIGDIMDENYPPMVVVEPSQALLHVSRKDFSFVEENSLGELFKLFAKHRVKVNMMQNTAISFSICVNYIPERIETLLEELTPNYKVQIDKSLELITVRHYQKDLLETLKKGKIVLLEEYIRKTAQIVIKDVPFMTRK